jgi:hypothetical protein
VDSGLAAHVLQEARGGEGQVAAGGVQDLAFVGTLEIRDVEAGGGVERDLEEEEVEVRVRGQHVATLLEIGEGAAHSAASEEAVADVAERARVEGRAIQLDAQAVAVDQTRELQLQLDRRGQ